MDPLTQISWFGDALLSGVQQGLFAEGSLQLAVYFQEP